MPIRKVAPLLLAFCTAGALAADTGELWEVSTVMNMPGMPAGMGASSSRVCVDKNQSPASGRKECKTSNVKRSGLTETMTITCPDGTMTVEMTYNAARTEYKGKMSMSGGRGDGMVINTSGKKLGACDPQVAQAQRDQRSAEMKKKMEGAMASGRAASQDQAKRCQAGVENMNWGELQLGFMCVNNPSGCKTDPQDSLGQRPMYETCRTAAVEFCKRYQTMEGFRKAKGDEQAAKQCKVSTAQLKASFCPRAEKAEDLGFVGAYCPAERERLAKKHCTGRSYTSMPPALRTLCQGRTSEDLEEARGSTPAQPAAPASKGGSTKDAVTEGVSQGINKLKGLFGR